MVETATPSRWRREQRAGREVSMEPGTLSRKGGPRKRRLLGAAWRAEAWAGREGGEAVWSPAAWAPLGLRVGGGSLCPSARVPGSPGSPWGRLSPTSALAGGKSPAPGQCLGQSFWELQSQGPIMGDSQRVCHGPHTQRTGRYPS